MKVKVCPNCGKHNPESAWSCENCGATLSIRTLIDIDLENEEENKPHVYALYIMAFTPEILDPNTLKEISFYAGDILERKVPIFKQLWEKGLQQKARVEIAMEIANHQHLASVDTQMKYAIETMKASMKSWLEGEFKLTFDPVFGKNFFMQGVRDPQGKENTILFYFGVEE